MASLFRISNNAMKISMPFVKRPSWNNCKDLPLPMAMSAPHYPSACNLQHLTAIHGKAEAS